MGNALALRGEEGRDKLRKAAGIGTYKLIRRYPNGATHYIEDVVSARRRTRGTETSKEKLIIPIAKTHSMERLYQLLCPNINCL